VRPGSTARQAGDFLRPLFRSPRGRYPPRPLDLVSLRDPGCEQPGPPASALSPGVTRTLPRPRAEFVSGRAENEQLRGKPLYRVGGQIPPGEYEFLSTLATNTLA